LLTIAPYDRTRVSELLFFLPVPLALFRSSSLSTLHQFTNRLLDVVVFTLDPLNNPPAPLRLHRTLPFRLWLKPAVAHVVSLPFPLVTTCRSSPSVPPPTAVCLFLSSRSPPNLACAEYSRGVPSAVTRSRVLIFEFIDNAVALFLCYGDGANTGYLEYEVETFERSPGITIWSACWTGIHGCSRDHPSSSGFRYICTLPRLMHP